MVRGERHRFQQHSIPFRKSEFMALKLEVATPGRRSAIKGEGNSSGLPAIQNIWTYFLCSLGENLS